MKSPDDFFKPYEIDFEKASIPKARCLFRRAIREYFVMRRRYVINPETGMRTKSVLMGEVFLQQKHQRRRVERVFRGRTSIGRPTKPEIKLLIARLFILWGRYAKTPATLSWKTKISIQTNFEIFLHDLLPQLGAPDVRRYVEAHWRERE